MSFNVRYTRAAREDLIRLRKPNTAEHALKVMRDAVTALEQFPFSCKKADAANPFLRELIVPFGSAGYVALFEIDNDTTVTILAFRHQLEDDYH